MNRTHPPADTDLRVFRDPASVAVVGATAGQAKWGYWLAKGALAGRHRREVYLVNRSGAEILGEASHRCLGELPATLRHSVTSVSAPEADQVTLYLAGGITVLWGDTGRPGVKARELTVLMRGHMRYYDVSGLGSVAAK